MDAKLAARQVMPRFLLPGSASSENSDRAEKSPSDPIQNGISKQQVVFVQKSDNLVEIKAFEKFYRRHMGDILRIKFFA
jgi:hypothetical protein